MPPKKGTTKAKPQELAEVNKQPKNPIPQTSSLNTPSQPIKSKYLRIYNEFYCATSQPGFFNANQAYLKKIGALQKHRIDRYYLRMEKNTEWTDKLLVFQHLEKFKRIRKISFYMGRKNINTGNKLPQQAEILEGFRKIIRRLPHLSKIEFIYPNKIDALQTLRQIGNLNHITLGLNFSDLLKDQNEKKLIQLLSRDFRYHRINSAKLICYGASGAAKKAKKASKGKAQGKNPKLKPVEYLSPAFNHLTQMQKLALDFQEAKIFNAFKPLLAGEVFSQLKSLSIQSPDGGFSIESNNDIILEPALSLFEALLGKPLVKSVSKKTTASKSTTTKPEISIKNYENNLKNHAETISQIGTVKSLTIQISKTNANELLEMFSHFKHLKILNIQYSPIGDWQILEVCQAINNIEGLTDLELYLKNYTFSKDSIKEIHNSILSHSTTLKKLCLGFQDADNITDTASIMNTVLQIPSLTIFRLYLGYVGSYKKSLRPLRNLSQLKRLTELEVGAFFNLQSLEDIAAEFSEILKNLHSLRYLSLKPVWHYDMWDGGSKEDFTVVLNELQMLRRLKGLFLDFENSTWLPARPK